MADLGSLLGGIGVGGFIGQAVVKLELDTAKYNAELKGAQAQTVAGTNQMSSGIGKFGGFAQAAFLGVGAAAVVGIGYAIKAGSDLNEQLNKTRVVFEDSADSVISFSETTASSLGVAQAEALTAAGNFGQLFDAAGLATDAAAKMSIEMVQLSADLGSFNNIPVAEALEKIRSGLAGEAEPLRQLGVFLSEAAVEQEAYASGIAKVGAELTDAQKVQARYNIILGSTTKAQGDFGRTVGESVPNQIKVLTAELKDLSAEIGTKLLPVVLEALKALKLLADAVAAPLETPAIDVVFNIERGKEYAQGLRDIFEAYNLAKGADEEFHRAAEALAEQFGVSQASVEQRVYDMLALADAVTGVARAEEAGVDAAQRVKAGFEDAGFAARGYGDDIEHTGKKVREFANMTGKELKDWEAQTKESIETAIFALEDLSTDSGITRRDVIGAFQMMADEAANFNRALKVIAKEKWINDEFVKFLVEQGPEWLTAFTELNEKEQRAAQQAWQETTKKTDAAKDSLDKITGVLKDLDGKTSKHTVIIDYRYEGFDPTKPGMNAPAPRI